jgi:hypothetical protein
MKVKRVRIKKANLGTYWYANQIGEEFDIIGYKDWKLRYQVIDVGTFNERPMPRYIEADDCEVVNEFDADILESVTITIQKIK